MNQIETLGLCEYSAVVPRLKEFSDKMDAGQIHCDFLPDLFLAAELLGLEPSGILFLCDTPFIQAELGLSDEEWDDLESAAGVLRAIYQDTYDL